jgi:hypothetical protein
MCKRKEEGNLELLLPGYFFPEMVKAQECIIAGKMTTKKIFE